MPQSDRPTSMPELDRDSKADEFDESDGLMAGEGADDPKRVAKAPANLRHMAQKTWLFLSITTLLNVHNTIDGGELTHLASGAAHVCHVFFVCCVRSSAVYTVRICRGIHAILVHACPLL